MGVETWAEEPTEGPSDWVSWVAETLDPAKNRLTRVAADSAFVAFMVLPPFCFVALDWQAAETRPPAVLQVIKSPVPVLTPWTSDNTVFKIKLHTAFAVVSKSTLF
jgi:hypothetical protein